MTYQGGYADGYAGGVGVANKTLTDPLGITDVITALRAGAGTRSLTDPLALTDTLTLTRSGGGAFTLSETLQGSDAITVDRIIPTIPTSTPGRMRLRLVAYTVGGARLGDVPFGLSLSRYSQMGEVPTADAEYSLLQRNVPYLNGPVEVSLQYSDVNGNWREPINGRYLIDKDDYDRLDNGQLVHHYGFLGYATSLRYAGVGGSMLDTENRRVFNAATPGLIMDTLINQAKAAGFLPFVNVGFTANATSDGQPWRNVCTRGYAPETDLLTVVQEMFQGGLVDFWFDGRTFHMSNPDTALGRDLSTGNTPVYIRDQGLSASPESVAYGDMITKVMVVGDRGFRTLRDNPAASRVFGERVITLAAGGVEDEKTAFLQALELLARGSAPSRSLSREYTVTEKTRFAPERNYRTGDWIKADTSTMRGERMRAFATSVREEAGELKAFVTLGTVHDDLLLRMAKRQNGITGGAGVNTGGRPTPDPKSDSTPPAKVAGLVGSSDAYLGPGGFAQAQVVLTWNAPTLNANGTTITDLDHYEIFQRPFGSTPPGPNTALRMVATTTDETWTNAPYKTGSNWWFSVKAVDTYGNRSALSTEVAVGMADDATPPQAPTAPVLTAKLGIVRAFWDGDPATGTWGPDFDHVEVHISVVSGFTPTATTQTDTLYGEGPSILTDLAYGVAVYAKLIAVDKSGNKSVPSGQGTATPTQLVNTDLITSIVTARLLAPDAVTQAAIADLAVGTANMLDLSVVTAKIGNLAVNDAKIASLSVGKLTAGSLTAEVLVASRLTTATSGNRIEMSGTGIRAYRGTFMTGHWNPAVGQLRLYNSGDASLTSTAHGIQFGESDDYNLIIDNNEMMARFNGGKSALGLNLAGGRLVLGGKPGGFRADRADVGDFPDTTDHQMEVRAAVEIQSRADGGYANDYSPLRIGPRMPGRTSMWFDNNTIGVSNDAGEPGNLELMPSQAGGINHDRSVIMASNSFELYRRTSSSAVIGGKVGIDVALLFKEDNLGVLGSGLASYRSVIASAFTVSSQRAAKRDITNIDQAILAVRGAPSYRWRYNQTVEENSEADRWHFGPMLEDLPDEMRRPIQVGEGYDVSSLLGLLWEALRDVDGRLQNVENQ